MSAPFRVEHATRSSQVGVTLLAGAFVILAAAPFWGGRDDLRLLAEIYAYVALASLWNLLAGYAGLVSVGQQAYVGLGAYVLFGACILGGVHPLAAIPLAGIVGAESEKVVDAARLAVDLRRSRAVHLANLAERLPDAIPLVNVPYLFTRSHGLRTTRQVAEFLGEELL